MLNFRIIQRDKNKREHEEEHIAQQTPGINKNGRPRGRVTSK